MSPSPVPRESHLQRVPGDFPPLPTGRPKPDGAEQGGRGSGQRGGNYRVRSQAVAAVGVLWAPGLGRSPAPWAHAHARP